MLPVGVRRARPTRSWSTHQAQRIANAHTGALEYPDPRRRRSDARERPGNDHVDINRSRPGLAHTGFPGAFHLHSSRNPSHHPLPQLYGDIRTHTRRAEVLGIGYLKVVDQLEQGSGPSSRRAGTAPWTGNLRGSKHSAGDQAQRRPNRSR